MIRVDTVEVATSPYVALESPSSASPRPYRPHSPGTSSSYPAKTTCEHTCTSSRKAKTRHIPLAFKRGLAQVPARFGQLVCVLFETLGGEPSVRLNTVGFQ